MGSDRLVVSRFSIIEILADVGANVGGMTQSDTRFESSLVVNRTQYLSGAKYIYIKQGRNSTTDTIIIKLLSLKFI